MRPGRVALSFVALAAGLATAVHATETCRLTDEATKACAGTCGPTHLVEYGCVSVDGDVVGNWSTCTRRFGEWSDCEGPTPYTGSWPADRNCSTFTPFPFGQWVTDDRSIPRTIRTDYAWFRPQLWGIPAARHWGVPGREGGVPAQRYRSLPVAQLRPEAADSA